MDAKRLLPLSGIAFVALIAVAIAVGGEAPASTAPNDEIVAHYDDTTQFVGPFIVAASVPFLVLFAAGVAAARAGAALGRRPWERVLVGGSVLTGAVLLIAAMTSFALADGADNAATAGALETLNLFVGASWVALAASLGVVMLGGAGTLLSHPRSHAWLGWTALVLGIALFIPFADFFAMLLTGIWIIVTGVVLVRGPAERAEAVAVEVA